MTWKTRGILVSIRVRDSLYKRSKCEPDLEIKTQTFNLYKRYRNMIEYDSLLRKSKQNHYSQFFRSYQGNVRKTWEGIRNLINVSKKKNVLP